MAVEIHDQRNPLPSAKPRPSVDNPPCGMADPQAHRQRITHIWTHSPSDTSGP
jgi:hypothetical protein